MQNLEEMLTFASAAAALVIQRKGALKVMPRCEEIVELLRQHGKDVR
jgi:sugar/nucleoside kinase (ribokinase family)